MTAITRPNPAAVLTSTGIAVGPMDVSMPDRRSDTIDGASDCELAQRIARGDRTAATELVGRYQATIRSFLLRVTGDRHLADDLAQETFIRVLRYADRFDPKYAMKTWLLTIARRLSINHARDNRRSVLAETFDHLPADSHSPAHSTAKKDQEQHRKSIIDAAMAKLSVAQREAVTLFYQQEQSVQQIAELMDIPEGTVKSHLYRARAALKHLLAPELKALEE